MAWQVAADDSEDAYLWKENNIGWEKESSIV